MDETVWLTQALMAELFTTSPENVLMHLKNIYSERELEQISTTKDFLVVRQEGNRQVKRTLKHYSLDAIISVGYQCRLRPNTEYKHQLFQNSTKQSSLGDYWQYRSGNYSYPC